MPELQAPRGADSSESAATWLLDRLAAWVSERVVVTLFASGDPLVVSHASVLLGPTAMANRSWPDWAASEGELTHDTWRGGPARFAISVGSCQLARASLTQRQARAWLAGAIAGRAPAIAGLPAADMQVDTARARYTAMMRKGNASWASKFVLGAARPAEGFLIPLVSTPAVADANIEIGGAAAPPFIHLGIDVPDASNRSGERAAPALVVGRLNRQAWIAGSRFRPDEPFSVRLRAERGGVDLRSVRLVVREYANDELVAAATLAIRDVRTPARIRTNLWVRAPTTGRGVGRTLELYADDGTLLDARDKFHFVEEINIQLSVDGNAQPPIKIGDGRPPPDLSERLIALDRRRSEWDLWMRHGLRYRVVTDTAGVERYVRARLRSAPGELLIIDPYFGKDGQGWSLLTSRSGFTRILTGRAASPPHVSLPQVQARSLPAPPPYHDRFYVWQGSGLSVGASAGGLSGKRAFRIDYLDSYEVMQWRASFETWWSDPNAAAV